MPSTYYTIKCFIYGSSLGAVLPRSYQHHHLLAGSHAGQEGRGGTQKVALGPGFGSFENLSIRIYASPPPLTKQLQAKYLFSLSEAGTNGAEGQSPVYRGRKDIFSGLADKLKKKTNHKYTTHYSLSFRRAETTASFRRSLGGLRTQHMGAFSSIRRSVTDTGLGLFRDAASNPCATGCFTPHPISPRSNLYTNLGGLARVRIYIQTALGTKQKMFPLCMLFNIALLRYNLPTPKCVPLIHVQFHELSEFRQCPITTTMQFQDNSITLKSLHC